MAETHYCDKEGGCYICGRLFCEGRAVNEPRVSRNGGDYVTIQEVDEKIRELKAQIKEWRTIREEVINRTSLFPESQLFIYGGLAASEALRKSKPGVFAEKCSEAGFDWQDRRVYGLNACHHRGKWENAKTKACQHASNRRVNATIHLTEDELRLAKIYAMAYAKEWIEFWEGDIRDESWKTYRP